MCDHCWPLTRSFPITIIANMDRASVDLSVFLIKLIICSLQTYIATSDKSIKGRYKRLEEELEVGGVVGSCT
jgi:hypothetical protein